MIFNKELLLYINTENIKFNRLMVDFVDLLIDEFDITDMLCLIERLEESSTLARNLINCFLVVWFMLINMLMNSIGLDCYVKYNQLIISSIS